MEQAKPLATVRRGIAIGRPGLHGRLGTCSGPADARSMADCRMLSRCWGAGVAGHTGEAKGPSEVLLVGAAARAALGRPAGFTLHPSSLVLRHCGRRRFLIRNGVQSAQTKRGRPKPPPPSHLVLAGERHLPGQPVRIRGAVACEQRLAVLRDRHRDLRDRQGRIHSGPVPVRASRLSS
jgi:hypothetical protein